MRRALLAVLATGTLLTAAACDTGAKDSTDAAAASATPSRVPDETLPPLPDYSADTKQVCDRLQTVYTGELAAFGTAMGKMVSYKEAKQAADAQKAQDTAAVELKAAGSKIQKTTSTAQDPDVQAAGVASAEKLDEGAQDKSYFNKVKTLKDLDTTLQTQMNEWLTPVTGVCESPS